MALILSCWFDYELGGVGVRWLEQDEWQLSRIEVFLWI